MQRVNRSLRVSTAKEAHEDTPTPRQAPMWDARWENDMSGKEAEGGKHPRAKKRLPCEEAARDSVATENDVQHCGKPKRTVGEAESRERPNKGTVKRKHRPHEKKPQAQHMAMRTEPPMATKRARASKTIWVTQGCRNNVGNMCNGTQTHRAHSRSKIATTCVTPLGRHPFISFYIRGVVHPLKWASL